MFRAAIAFFVLAIVAYIFGANGIVGISMEIGKVLLGVFVLLSVVSFLIAITTGRNAKGLN